MISKHCFYLYVVHIILYTSKYAKRETLGTTNTRLFTTHRMSSLINIHMFLSIFPNLKTMISSLFSVLNVKNENPTLLKNECGNSRIYLSGYNIYMCFYKCYLNLGIPSRSSLSIVIEFEHL